MGKIYYMITKITHKNTTETGAEAQVGRWVALMNGASDK